MNLQVTFDDPTAAKVAEFFAASGMNDAAEAMWRGLCVSAPHAVDARINLGEFLLKQQGARYAPGTPERSRFLLDVIGQTFPSENLSRAYFENLEQLIRARPQPAQPGRVVLGLGTGRCGSTSFAAAVALLRGACATHENPPVIFWEPHRAQVQFHVTRLKRLAEYFEIVFDASHWWLNALEQVFAEIPRALAIGLHRDTHGCVRSFLNIKGSGPGSLNHWAPPGSGYWAVNLWDATYPKFPLAAEQHSDPEAARAAMIERYVRDYRDALECLAQRHGSRVLLVATEQLAEPALAAQLSQVFGQPFSMPRQRLNVHSTTDSDLETLRF